MLTQNRDLAVLHCASTVSATVNPTLVVDERSDWSKFTSHIVRTGKEGTDEKYTPDWVLDLAIEVMGGIDLDPCADPRKRVPASKHFTIEENGLQHGWDGRVFLNPPFSRTADWLKHLCLYHLTGAVTQSITLVPVMVLSNKSARLLMHEVASGFVILERNIAFLDSNYNSMGEMGLFPCSLVYAGDKLNRFLNVAGKYGVPCAIKKQHSQKKSVSCEYCGNFFPAQRSTAKYCSTTCRVEAHRDRTSKSRQSS